MSPTPPLPDQSDVIEIRCLWQQTDYGSISLKAAARGYGGRELGSYQDEITGDHFAQIRATEAEINPAWPLVESVIKVPAKTVESLFTDGTEIALASDERQQDD